MPPVKLTRTQSNGAPVAEISPEEAAKIRSSVGAREQAPSTQQSAIFTNWRQVADQLGDPFEVERIPISKLRAMRRDPMLGFGLSFIKTPHVRAHWYINAKDNNGPNAQIAAHLDQDLRRIYASLVFCWMNCLDFGFQGIAKRFEFRIPSGTFIATDPNTGEQSEQPIWSAGNVQPIAWKPFVALAPEAVEPIWDGKGGFNGIDYDGSLVPGVTAGGSNQHFKIDLYHSLWVTNERDSNFGSIFGYPRLGYAYRYWWSYWFRWAIADRAFEKRGDPSVKIYHPDGEFVDDQTGERMSYAEYALQMGQQMRSGGVIALPSELYEDNNGRGTVRQWEMEFTQDATNFQPFDESFDYLDIQKLRALWIPEQAFLEGKGGTSSRNVAAEVGDSFVESQAVLAAQLVETINRWVIPQWLAVNYPEFLAANGSAEFIMQGFADEDVEFTKQVIQLIGQQEAGVNEILKLVDLEKVLQDAGTPLADVAKRQRQEQAIAQAAAAAQAPQAVAGGPGTVGVLPTASAAGFTYYQPRDTLTVQLAESGNKFVDSLPNSQHYEDNAIKGHSRTLWRRLRKVYQQEYEEAIKAIEEATKVQTSDGVETDLVVEMANPMDSAKKLLAKWKASALGQALVDARDTMRLIAKRAARLELSKANLTAKVADDDIANFIETHLDEVATKIAETTHNEVQNFVANQIALGITNKNDLANLARRHFEEFPNWKTDRLVRTEVRDIYNAATLLAAEAAGIKQVQAVDAQISADTDKDCVKRNGRFFTLSDARKEDEHPNGTLGWRIPSVHLSVKYVDDVGIENAIGRFDPETNTILLSEKATDEQAGSYMTLIADFVNGRN
jgi:hypothetical protein